MRRLAFLIALLFLGYSLNAQTSVPPGIAYQAVAIKPTKSGVAGFNPDGLYWTNRDVSVRFTIYEKWPGGTNQYSEIHDLRTDAFGTFGCIIGQGTVVSGNFNTIPWSLGTAHLQVEIDYYKDGDYTLIGVERFWSVPYAMLSNDASNSAGAGDVYSKSYVDSLTNLLLGQIQYLKNRDKDTAIGNDGVSNNYVDSQFNSLKNMIVAIKNSDKDTVIGNELQDLYMSNDTIRLTQSSEFVVIKNDQSNGSNSTPTSGSMPFIVADSYLDSIFDITGFDVKTNLNPNGKFSGCNATIYGDSIYIIGLYSPGTDQWGKRNNYKIVVLSVSKLDKGCKIVMDVKNAGNGAPWVPIHSNLENLVGVVFDGIGTFAFNAANYSFKLTNSQPSINGVMYMMDESMDTAFVCKSWSNTRKELIKYVLSTNKEIVVLDSNTISRDIYAGQFISGYFYFNQTDSMNEAGVPIFSRFDLVNNQIESNIIKLNKSQIKFNIYYYKLLPVNHNFITIDNVNFVFFYGNNKAFYNSISGIWNFWSCDPIYDFSTNNCNLWSSHDLNKLFNITGTFSAVNKSAYDNVIFRNGKYIATSTNGTCIEVGVFKMPEVRYIK